MALSMCSASTCQNDKLRLYYSYGAHSGCAASEAGELWTAAAWSGNDAAQSKLSTGQKFFQHYRWSTKYIDGFGNLALFIISISPIRAYLWGCDVGHKIMIRVKSQPKVKIGEAGSNSMGRETRSPAIVNMQVERHDSWVWTWMKSSGWQNELNWAANSKRFGPTTEKLFKLGWGRRQASRHPFVEYSIYLYDARAWNSRLVMILFDIEFTPGVTTVNCCVVKYMQIHAWLCFSFICYQLNSKNGCLLTS